MKILNKFLNKLKKASSTPPPRKFRIPQKYILEVLELVDIYYKTKENEDHVAKYNLWTRIYEILPEIPYNIRVHLKFPTATTIEIIEGFENNDE